MTDSTISRSEAETVAAGQALGVRLAGGATVLLYGELGAGKTAFVRGLAMALGIDPGEVSSPTFTLVQEYRGRRTLYHVDLYRLSPNEAGGLGLEEMAGHDAILAIEWADRLDLPPDEVVRVTIEDAGDDSRRITIDGVPPEPYSSR